MLMQMDAHIYERPSMMGHAIVASGSRACVAMQADGQASRYAVDLMNDHADGNPFRLTPIYGANKPTLCIGEATARRPVNPKILEEIARVMIGHWDGCPSLLMPITQARRGKIGLRNSDGHPS